MVSLIKNIDEAKIIARLLFSACNFIAMDKDREIYAYKNEPHVQLNKDFTETHWIDGKASLFKEDRTAGFYVGRYIGKLNGQWSDKYWEIR